LGFRGGARVRIRVAMRIRDPAGPTYPPKSDSPAISWLNWERELEASTTASTGAMLAEVIARDATTQTIEKEQLEVVDKDKLECRGSFQ
jgi:hypothetical protein